MKGVRSTCQAETGAEDDIVDGINFGHFPKDQKLMVIQNSFDFSSRFSH